jgi:hypothetical protein
VFLMCVLFQQGPVASQPLSVSIPQDRSITPAVQDFTDPNMFYLPAYYYGGEGPSRNYYRDRAIKGSAILPSLSRLPFVYFVVCLANQGSSWCLSSRLRRNHERVG